LHSDGYSDIFKKLNSGGHPSSFMSSHSDNPGGDLNFIALNGTSLPKLIELPGAAGYLLVAKKRLSCVFPGKEVTNLLTLRHGCNPLTKAQHPAYGSRIRRQTGKCKIFEE
jgi:hypothetical protein